MPKTSNALRVGIWIRVSTEDQAQGDSPEHHERRARAYAESRDWVVAKAYKLEAVSGKSVKDHPEAKRMLNDLREGRIQALIFSKLARLARNTKELLDFADTFQEHDAGLVSLQEAIDTSTPAGRFFYTLLAAMAQWEREEISDRVAASVPIRAKLGKPLGGQATFGYRWQGKELVPDPDEAPVRRRLHELFAEHRRLRTVATILNDAGYRTRAGAPFSKTTVLRLLRDSTAKGIRIANHTRLSANGKRVEAKNRSEWVEVPVEPIVSEELWNECARILEENARPARRAGRKPIHLFAGFAACQCGNKLYVRSNSPYYACRRKGCRVKIGVEDLERLYRGELTRYLHTRGQVEGYLKLADETLEAKEQLLGTLRKEHRRIVAEADGLIELHRKGVLEGDSFEDRFSPLEVRRKQLAEELATVEAEVDLLKVETLNADHILSETRDLYSKWPRLSKPEKRRVVEAITREIVVGKGEITFKMFYFPPLPPFGKPLKKDRNLDPSAWRRPAYPSARSLPCATGWVFPRRSENRPRSTQSVRWKDSNARSPRSAAVACGGCSRSASRRPGISSVITSS